MRKYRRRGVRVFVRNKTPSECDYFWNKRKSVFKRFLYDSNLTFDQALGDCGRKSLASELQA